MTNLPNPFLDPTDFPTVDPALLAALQQNFDELADLQVDTGERQIKLRYGAGTVTWGGVSATSNTLTVAHGLGSTPVAVLATHNDQTDTGFCMVEARGDATNVYVRLATTGFTPPNTAASPLSWTVIG